jgi:tetratricopeptide (TPR) repeat protein
VFGVAYSPDGTRLATASEDKTARLWDARTGQLLRELTGHTEMVTRVAFSPDGQRLATGSSAGTARLWDARTGQMLLELKGRSSDMVFTPDGTRLIADRWDRAERMWDGRVGQTVLLLKGHSTAVTGIAFSADGQRLVSESAAAEDGTPGEVKAWDVATGAPLDLAADPPPPAGQRQAASPDGKYLAWVNDTRIQVRRTADRDTAEQHERALSREWHQRLALESETAGEDFAAAFHLDRVLRADPQNEDARRRRARLHAEQGRVHAEGAEWSLAVAEFSAAAELDAGDPSYLRHHVLALLAAGRAAECQRRLARLLGDAADGPGPSAAEAVVAAAVLCADPGVEPERLVELAERAARRQPGTFGPLEVLAAALNRAGRPHEALKRLDMAAELHGGGSALARLLRATALARLGHTGEARAALEEAPDPADHGGDWQERLVQRFVHHEAVAALEQNGGRVP